MGIGGSASPPSKPPSDRLRAGAGRRTRLRRLRLDLENIRSVGHWFRMSQSRYFRHAFPLFCGKAALHPHVLAGRFDAVCQTVAWGTGDSPLWSLCEDFSIHFLYPPDTTQMVVGCLAGNSLFVGRAWSAALICCLSLRDSQFCRMSPSPSSVMSVTSPRRSETRSVEQKKPHVMHDPQKGSFPPDSQQPFAWLYRISKVA